MCAVCKNGVVRKFQNRLACENPGCVDLTIPVVFTDMGIQVPWFHMETLMNHLSSLVHDHDQSCQSKLKQHNVQFGLAIAHDHGEIEF